MATQWYYQLMGQELGPISSAQLKHKVLAGEIDPNTLVHTDAHREWFLADQVPGLFSGAEASKASRQPATMAEPAAPDAEEEDEETPQRRPAQRHPINEKIPKKRQEELDPGEEAYDFTYLDQEGGPPGISATDQWIMVTSRRVAYDATIRKGELEFARCSAMIPLEAILRVNTHTSAHKLGCRGRRYSFLTIARKEETVDLVIPSEEEAIHLKRAIEDLIR